METNPVLGNTLIIWIEMVNTEKVETSVGKPQQVPSPAGLGCVSGISVETQG